MTTNHPTITSWICFSIAACECEFCSFECGGYRHDGDSSRACLTSKYVRFLFKILPLLHGSGSGICLRSLLRPCTSDFPLVHFCNGSRQPHTITLASTRRGSRLAAGWPITVIVIGSTSGERGEFVGFSTDENAHRVPKLR